MKILRFDWEPILKMNKYFGKKHSYKVEKARRVKQIKKGQLTVSNGLEVLV